MSAQAVLDFERAREARDDGIKSAVDHADQARPEWSDVAYAFIENFARTTETFISEEVTAAAAKWGLSSPADPRAWGGPFKRAATAGVIEKIGFGISKRRHLSPTPLWKSKLYRSAA